MSKQARQVDELKVDIEILGEQLNELRAFAQTLREEASGASFGLQLAITTILSLLITAVAWVGVALKEEV